jgi:hypothetical protein
VVNAWRLAAHGAGPNRGRTRRLSQTACGEEWMMDRRSIRVDTGAGLFWFIGWLFTIAFAKLLWWQALLGLMVWPYYLGLAVR